MSLPLFTVFEIFITREMSVYAKVSNIQQNKELHWGENKNKNSLIQVQNWNNQSDCKLEILASVYTLQMCWTDMGHATLEK